MDDVANGSILNKTTGKKVCASFDTLETPMARMRGLMFRAKPENLLFVFDGGKERHASACAIHSLFVFFPFSAIYLDARKRVMDSRVCSPFTTFMKPKRDAAYLLEGGPELAAKVKEGDVLEFGV
jgi:uncharacterized membrane protein (UPF0127 family)